jgi:hypothetical protein
VAVHGSAPALVQTTVVPGTAGLGQAAQVAAGVSAHRGVAASPDGVSLATHAF